MAIVSGYRICNGKPPAQPKATPGAEINFAHTQWSGLAAAKAIKGRLQSVRG